MAFPYVFASNFESGSNSEWDSETDAATPAQLDFPHYSELARFPGLQAPFSGAYCMRLILTGQTGDALLTEGDLDITGTATSWFKFDIFFANDFAATVTDTIHILELKAGSTVEVTVGFKVTTAGVITMGIGETAPTSFGSELRKNQWYTVEIKSVNDTGTNDGTIDIYVTEANKTAATAVDATQITTLDQGAITTGDFGISNHLATTTGTFLLDNFIQDDERVFPTKRYDQNPIIILSGHAFVGPGDIAGAALLTDEASNQMRLWDTDVADTNATQSFDVEFDLDNQTSLTGPLHFEKGCYVELSGTNPRGQVFLLRNSLVPGARGPTAHSDANIRRYGLKRSA